MYGSGHRVFVCRSKSCVFQFVVQYVCLEEWKRCCSRVKKDMYNINILEEKKSRSVRVWCGAGAQSPLLQVKDLVVEFRLCFRGYLRDLTLRSAD